MAKLMMSTGGRRIITKPRLLGIVNEEWFGMRGMLDHLDHAGYCCVLLSHNGWPDFPIIAGTMGNTCNMMLYIYITVLEQSSILIDY